MSSSVFVILFLFIGGTNAFADITVTRLLTAHQIEIRAFPEQLEVGERLPILSLSENNQVVGYAQVETVKEDVATAKLLSRSENTMILPGDHLQKVDLTKKSDIFFGRSDLLTNEKHDSARYKPLVYLESGPVETAATLQKGENLISLETFYAYGLTSHLSLDTLIAADIVALPSLGIKVKTFENETITLSQEIFGIYAPTYGGYGAIIGEFYFDAKSSAKLISHTQIYLAYSSLEGAGAPIQGQVTQTKQYSNIQSGYEYVLSNWNRILAGPRYNLSRKTLGGFFSYVFIWDHLHILLGIKSDDFSDFRVHSEGYQANADVYWRF